MESFSQLEAVVKEIKDTAEKETTAANDNNSIATIAADSLKFALKNFLTEEQVRDIVQTEVLEYSCNKEIVLVTEKETKPLPNEPRHYLFKEILETVNLTIPAALIGPAGSGKSTCCEQIAKTLDLTFYLQNGVTGTHELTGFVDAHGKYKTTPFREAFEKGGLILIDEVDTSEASALKWINTGLANGFAVFPDSGNPCKRHNNFRILIAANTFGTGADRMYIGANQLDASTLDRFCFFNFDYDEKMELIIAGNHKWVSRVQKLRAAANNEKARIVISPRASINGAKLLSAGWKQDVVESRIIWKGIDSELKERIKRRAA
jgi:cobaltochelatase CobS